MKGIGIFLSPFLYYVIAFGLILISTIFYPAISNTVIGTRAQIAAAGVSENEFWGLSWGFDSARFLLFGASIFFVMIGLGIYWFKRKLRIQ